MSYNLVTNRGGYSSTQSQRKEERTGLIPVASPYRLPKGGLRHSEAIRGLSDFAIGGDS